MVDNVIADSGDSLGATFATDEIDGIQYPITKITYGALDSQTLVDPSNGLPVVNHSQVSTVNSSTTPLGIDAVFTGTSEDISNFAAVNISIYTDQDSAIDGVSLEWSTDGTNWDHTQTHTVTADTSFIIQAMSEGNYFRLVYTNGGTGQGVFRLKVIYKVVPSIGEVQQLDEAVDDNSDAQLVRAVLTARKPDTTYTNIQSTAGGNLKVSVEEFDTPLPAGTNNIGDVDVLTLPASVQGPGNPSVDSYAHVAINLTTGANQVLVSSAASKQIWVYGYALTCGDANGQTVSLQDEDDTAVTGTMEFAQYGGISAPPSGNFSMPLFKLATDKDLEIDITGGDVDGWLAYAIVSV